MKIFSFIARIFVGVMLVGVLYYFLYPPINLTSASFYMFLLLAAIIFWVVISLSFRPTRLETFSKIGLITVVGVMIIGYAGISFLNTPIFRAVDYANIADIEERDFDEDFPETSPDNLALIDRESADLIGERSLGSLVDNVSQYELADDYTQITANEHPYRVSPLKYASMFRWFSNRNEGIPSYVQIDMTNGKAELVDVEEPMKYTTGEYFNRNLERHLQMSYPTSIFGDPSFEIDEQGKPYYVATVYDKKFMTNVMNPKMVITVDAATGEFAEYELDEVPEWVDRVYSADIMQDYINYNGKFENGFLNSIFSKNGVTHTTEGYSYVAIDNDVYMYTGITSANADASSVGVSLVNMSTGEITYYDVPIATEVSAMDSAKGAVQEKGYVPTFPTLIRVDGEPLYVMSLKDESGLVKQYAVVLATDYQQVHIGNSLNEAFNKYYESTGNIPEESEEDTDTRDIEGTIEQIQDIVDEGNTFYYIQVEDGEVVKAKFDINSYLPFATDGDRFKGQLDNNNQLQEVEFE